MNFAFLKYISKFGKNYKSYDEYITRLRQFNASSIEIDEINKTSTSHHQINFLSDYLPNERKLFCGLQLPPPDLSTMSTCELLAEPPSTIDWKALGKVNAIKDQG